MLGAPSQDPKNVIILYIEDMGDRDICCYGDPYSTTNIDHFVGEGIRFAQYYSAAPVSSPSRCGLLTGMFPIVTAFHNADSATAHIGKWHLGGGRNVTNAPSIIEYGYDEYLSTYESPDPVLPSPLQIGFDLPKTV